MGIIIIFVLPHALYVKVKEEIPAAIGVLVYHAFSDQEKGSPGYFSVEKNRSGNLYSRQRKRIVVSFDLCTSTKWGRPSKQHEVCAFFSTERLYKELKKREPEYDLFGGGVNYYDRFIEDTQLQAIEALKEGTGCNARSLFRIGTAFFDTRKE